MEGRLMLLRNDLLHYSGDMARTLRLLWVHPESAGAAVIDIHDPRAWPMIVRVEQLVDDLENSRAHLVDKDPLIVVIKEDLISAKRVAARDRAWNIIAPLVDKEPYIYQNHHRGPLVMAVCKQHSVTHPTVYNYLRRYWQRGQSANALLPDFKSKGGKGRTRASKTGIKRGRPRKYDVDDGLNVTEPIRRIFGVAIRRYYLKHKKYSLSAAYQEMITDFFCNRRIDTETGEVVHHYADNLAPSGEASTQDSKQKSIPSLVQFRYWYEKDNQIFDIKRRRIGEKIYEITPQDLSLLRE